MQDRVLDLVDLVVAHDAGLGPDRLAVVLERDLVPGVQLAGRVHGLAQDTGVDADRLVLAAGAVDDRGDQALGAQLAGLALAVRMADLDSNFALLVHCRFSSRVVPPACRRCAP